MRRPAAVLALALACWPAAAGEADLLARFPGAEIVMQDARGNESRLSPGEAVPTRPRDRIFFLSDGTISPWAYELARWSDAEPADLVAAGSVAPDARAKPGQRFFVVSLIEPPEDAVLLHRVSDRETSMPVGPAVAGLVDKRGHTVAISSPFEVVAGKTSRPAMHAGGIYLQLSRSTEVDADDRALAHFGSKALPPDFLISDYTKVLAGWLFDSEAAEAFSMTASNAFDSVERILGSSLPGQLAFYSDRMRARPVANVDIVLPAGVDAISVATYRPTDRSEPASAIPLEGSAMTVDVRLEVGENEIRLETDKGAFSKTVTAELDDRLAVSFQPRLITISGTVTMSGEPVSRPMTFTTTQENRIETISSGDGSYSISALAPLRWLAVAAEDGSPPYTDLLAPLLFESGLFDVELPPAGWAVKVQDLETRRPISDARVHVKNTFATGSQSSESINQFATTDAEGRAGLPPIRPGFAILRASAEGYETSKPLEIEVAEEDPPRTLDIELEPLRDSITCEVRLWDGRPAAHAEVIVSNGSEAVFSGRVTAGGEIRLPGNARGRLLIRHPAAGFLVTHWAGDARELRLSPPGEALSVSVTDATGRPARAELALWVDSHKLSGFDLAWVTGQRPWTTPSGTWAASNLPLGAPISVVAWSLEAREDGRAGVYDALAESLGTQWPHPVRLTLAGD